MIKGSLMIKTIKGRQMRAMAVEAAPQEVAPATLGTQVVVVAMGTPEIQAAALTSPTIKESPMPGRES